MANIETTLLPPTSPGTELPPITYSSTAEDPGTEPPNLCRLPGVDITRVVGVFNRLSGERTAANTVMRGLFAVLGPANCVEMTPDVFRNPAPLKDIICKRALIQKHPAPLSGDDGAPAALPEERGTVLVAGGDGTISFVMSVIDGILEEYSQRVAAERREEVVERDDQSQQPLDENLLPILVPAVAVLPMGTGNDFANSMGFGTGYSKYKCCPFCCCCPDPIVEHIHASLRSREIRLDRWHAEYEEHPAPVDGAPQPRKKVLHTLTANNYIGVGIDSYLLSEFDRLRKTYPTCFRSRFLNKAWYGMIGVGALCATERINSTVEVFVDGVQRKIPPKSKGIIVSNLDSYAGGGLLWQVPKKPPPEYPHTPVSVNDGLVEVSAIGGVWHQGFVQIGFGGDKIAQGKKVEIVVHRLLPPEGAKMLRKPVHHFFQFDGEPLGNFPDISDTSDIHVVITHHRYPSYVRSSSK